MNPASYFLQPGAQPTTRTITVASTLDIPWIGQIL